jgi:tryptophanase
VELEPQTSTAVFAEIILPALERVRLTILRGVYTQVHLDVTAESVIDLCHEK